MPNARWHLLEAFESTNGNERPAAIDNLSLGNCSCSCRYRFYYRSVNSDDRLCTSQNSAAPLQTAGSGLALLWPAVLKVFWRLTTRCDRCRSGDVSESRTSKSSEKKFHWTQQITCATAANMRVVIAMEDSDDFFITRARLNKRELSDMTDRPGSLLSYTSVWRKHWIVFIICNTINPLSNFLSARKPPEIR